MYAIRSYYVYTPGPSMDAVSGVEFWRRAVLLDVLARHVRASGQEALAVAGLADMDDRTLAASDQ